MRLMEMLGGGVRTVTKGASLAGLVLFHLSTLSLHEDTASCGELVSESVEMVLEALLRLHFQCFQI